METAEPQPVDFIATNPLVDVVEHAVRVSPVRVVNKLACGHAVTYSGRKPKRQRCPYCGYLQQRLPGV